MIPKKNFNVLRMNFLDYLNNVFIWSRSYWPERKRWPMTDVSKDSIRIFYGYDTIDGSDQKVFGGFVKLQDLHKTFPNTTVGPNILYLISSALPRFSLRMAKMAKRAKVKIVINQNGVAYPGWYGKGWERCNKPMTELHKLADYVIYQSSFCKISADKFLGKHCQQNNILYNTVDTNVFCPVKNNKDKKITLLLAGSHWSFYRLEVAIKTLKLVCKQQKNVFLKIAGRFCWKHDNGVAQKQVMECAARCGIDDSIEYVGSYTQQQALQLLQSSSILLHTKYNDPCPRLVIEAMACGLPVVYSATGGVPELVGEEAGEGVAGPLDWEMDHPPEPSKLAEEVLRVIANFDQYSQAARKRALGHFDVNPWLKKHQEIFKHLLTE